MTELDKMREKTAQAMQKLMFRAVQQGGFVTVDECRVVTDEMCLTVIKSIAEYMELLKFEETQNAN